MSLELLTNNAQSTLGGSVDNSTDPVTFTVASATNFPTTGNFRVVIGNEILLVTSVSGTSFTASRAQEGTTIATHASGDLATHIITAASLKKLVERWGARAAIYPPFTPSGVDDEFDDENFSGFTQVDDSLHQPVITESNDVASIALPGGDTAAHLHAFMKAATVSAGDIIEVAMRMVGITQAFNIAGLVMSDGVTYNAGSQICWYWSPEEQQWIMGTFTGFNSFTILGSALNPELRMPMGDMFLRLKYEGSNSWSGWTSPDGISWINLTGSRSRTLTPTKVGFFCTTWGGAGPCIWSFRYFRKTT